MKRLEADKGFVKNIVKDIIIRKAFYKMEAKRAPVINLVEELKNSHKRAKK